MSNSGEIALEELRRGAELRAVNTSRGIELAGSLFLALDLWRRFRGLLGRAELRAGEGLLLRPCRAVHTIGMRYAIDALFIDDEGFVVGLERALDPYRFSRHHARALATLELLAGEAQTTQVGDRVAFLERR